MFKDNFRKKIRLVDDVMSLLSCKTSGSPYLRYFNPKKKKLLKFEELSDYLQMIKDVSLEKNYDDDTINHLFNSEGFYVLIVFYFNSIQSFLEEKETTKHRLHKSGLDYIIAMDENEDEPEYYFISFLKSDINNKNGILGKLRDYISLSLRILPQEFAYQDGKLEEFEVIYQDTKSKVLKPKTFIAAAAALSDTKMKAKLLDSDKWMKKHFDTGSYYAGYKWYRKKETVKIVKNWWENILNKPGKKVIEEYKEFVDNIPRYAVYVVVLKEYKFSRYFKLYLIFDISRDEYGSSIIKSYGLGSFDNLMDTAHNSLMIYDSYGKRITLKELYYAVGQNFSTPFSQAEYDYQNIKDELYKRLGIWADIGGEYTENPLFFSIPDKKDELSITTKDKIEYKTDPKTGNKSALYSNAGKYSDTNFDYFNFNLPYHGDMEYPDKEYVDYMTSIRNSVNDLMLKIDSMDENNERITKDGIKY